MPATSPATSKARQQWSVPRMWSHATPDEFLAPEPALPAQVYHLWHNSCAIGPERALALAVLNQAIVDVRRYQESGLSHHRSMHDDARAWIASDERSWPFAFVNLCDAFGLDVGGVRAELLAVAGRTRQAA